MKHEEFLRQVALGDREAFHQLYLETGRSVYSFILSILRLQKRFYRRLI